MSKNISERRDKLITDCMLYTKIVEDQNTLTVYAFKHDSVKCDFQIFYDECGKEFEDWVVLPVTTA